MTNDMGWTVLVFFVGAMAGFWLTVLTVRLWPSAPKRPARCAEKGGRVKPDEPWPDPPPQRLKTLEEFNREHTYSAMFTSGGDDHNGIACPTCGAELVDKSPWERLHSQPPQMRVKCPECGWAGWRVA